jgi:hypothetical protein
MLTLRLGRDQARYAGTLGSSEPSTKFLKKVVAREM